MEWVMWASAAVWLGLGLYVLVLMNRQQRLNTRVRVLEAYRGRS